MILNKGNRYVLCTRCVCVRVCVQSTLYSLHTALGGNNHQKEWKRKWDSS